MNDRHDGSGRATLARSLHELRLRAGLNQEQLAEMAELSQSQVSRAERDRRLLQPEQVARFARACSTPDHPVSDARIVELVSLAERVAADYVDARSILQRGAITFQERIARLEEDSQLVRAYQPGMVLGQLQTRDYARILFREREGRSDVEVEQLVDQRWARSSRLYDPARRWQFVLTGGALTWCMGSPAVMADQLEHLITISRVPNVDLRIIPARRPVDFTAAHGFHLYDEEAAMVGTVGATALLSKPDEVNTYSRLFERLRAVAAEGEHARQALAQIRDAYLADG